MNMSQYNWNCKTKKALKNATFQELLHIYIRAEQKYFTSYKYYNETRNFLYNIVHLHNMFCTFCELDLATFAFKKNYIGHSANLIALCGCYNN